MKRQDLKTSVQSVNEINFEALSLEIFKFQYSNNSVYKSWVDNLNVDPNRVVNLSEIPFLPISTFKTHDVISFNQEAKYTFTSSGTTGMIRSRHLILDIEYYLLNAINIFEHFYGSLYDRCILALLPSYLERKGSSLIAMVDRFISISKYSESDFYLYNHDDLFAQLENCKKNEVPTILFGVSFALLDVIKDYKLDFPELIVMETGGMKGRKEEMSRKMLHDTLSIGLGMQKIHSEYGMTELLSQAYSNGDGIFMPGKSMKVIVKDITDPMYTVNRGVTGVINVIDLANVDSCSFIETQDLGKSYADGSFEVIGRLDVSDVRGCNLMVSDI